MSVHPLPDGAAFRSFSMLYLNARGRFVEPGRDLDGMSDGREISARQLPDFLKRSLVLPDGVTDVFVWLHGWRTDGAAAIAGARRLFNGIVQEQAERSAAYPRLTGFRPGFVAVHWPSMSMPLPGGYQTVRDRARALTDNGDAEFFLASLLGYLEATNARVAGPGSKTLRARGGFYVHCIGHSFGGRFLTAAIRAAATPHSPQTLSLLEETGRVGRKVLSAEAGQRFEFTVDSTLVFQMAAPQAGFGAELSLLVHEAPLRGPLVLTHSGSDFANCLWHRVTEAGERAIGCVGAVKPRQDIGAIRLGELDYTYTGDDFGKPIVNVAAGWAFTAPWFEPAGSHGNFWFRESVHLLLSLADHVHGLP